MTTLQDHQIPRDLVECLRIEARNAANPPTEYVLADDGGRMIHKPKPDLDMAELLDQAANRITADGATIESLQAELVKTREQAEKMAEALEAVMDPARSDPDKFPRIADIMENATAALAEWKAT